MAATVSNMLSIDPTRNGKHSVLISDQLRKELEAPEKELISVQCQLVLASSILKVNRMLYSQLQAKARHIPSKDNYLTFRPQHRQQLQPYHLSQRR